MPSEPMTDRKNDMAWFTAAMVSLVVTALNVWLLWHPACERGRRAGYAAAIDSVLANPTRTHCDSLMDTPGAMAARALDVYGVHYVILTFNKRGGIISRVYNR